MTRTSFANFNCSLAKSLDLVGDKWTMLIIRDGFYGVRRFSQFQARLGMAKTVLSDRLSRLVENGIFIRSDVPGREVDYALSPMGRELFPVLVALTQWGDRWMNGGKPPVEIVSRQSGQPISALKIEDDHGGDIDPADIGFRPGPGANEETIALFEAARGAKNT